MYSIFMMFHLLPSIGTFFNMFYPIICLNRSDHVLVSAIVAKISLTAVHTFMHIGYASASLFWAFIRPACNKLNGTQLPYSLMVYQFWKIRTFKILKPKGKFSSAQFQGCPHLFPSYFVNCFCGLKETYFRLFT